MSAEAPDPHARRAELLQRLLELHDRLRSTESVAELFARGADHARVECGFGRGFVVGIRDGRLDASATLPLGDPESDQLRRALLADAPDIPSGTLEGELVRFPTRRTPDKPSVLAAALGLADPVFGVIAPERVPVGILVLDRPNEPIAATDRAIVALFSGMLGVVLEHVVLRARIAELSAELKYLTVSAQALAAEAFEGPITLPVDGRYLPPLPHLEGYAAIPPAGSAELLTDREREIALLVAQGRSNKEIAEQLYLSIQTVKEYVARVCHKLGATNRVEAAVRFLRLDQPTK